MDLLMAETETTKSKKKMPLTFTDEAIAKALIRRRGLQYLAANDLGISGGHMSERINSSEYLTSVRDNARQVRIDDAEQSLTELVSSKELGAVCFTLKTIGKSRGYTETSDNAVDKDTLKHFVDLMKLVTEKQIN
jgi:hypothetical protein